MSVLADAYNAVDPKGILTVKCPQDDDLLYLLVTTTGGAEVNLRFTTVKLRDKFFKDLVDAMRAG